ncbi:hypothetical protein IWQ61_010286 [Dispira simplex]|nr:hypothetical protein IWQ61_010286 [Dispira simplex]
MSQSDTSKPRNLRRRNVPDSEKKEKSRATGSTQSMMRLYTDDAPGLKVDPVVVLVLSLVFIASVFCLHIYGKLTRPTPEA